MSVRFRNSLTIAIILLLMLSCNSQDTADTFKIRTGVNVSHWLSQSRKRGPERAAYITEADFRQIASLGFDHVRIPVDEVQLWDSLSQKETEGFALLHNAIRWALDSRLRVIVDLHIIRSHHFNAAVKPLWSDPAEQDKLADLWWQLSTEMRSYPVSMVAYEILNEAVADDPQDWNELLARLIAQIRQKEPKRVIVIGSNLWQSASTFPDLQVPANDPNLLLSFHFYTPFALTHHKAPWTPIAGYDGPVTYPGQTVDTLAYSTLSPAAANAMRSFANGYFDKAVLEKLMSPALQKARSMNLPLYCGEYGVYPTIPNDIRLRYYSDLCDIFNANGIAYCHWCYKGDFPILKSSGEPDTALVSILTEK